MASDTVTPAAGRPLRPRRRWVWGAVVGALVIVGIILANTPVVANPGVQAGARFDRASTALSVSGTPVAGRTVYVRVAYAAGFQTDLLTLLLARPVGGGWTVVRRIPSTVSPSDAIDVMSVSGLGAGTYQATWVANNQTIGQATFQVAP